MLVVAAFKYQVCGASKVFYKIYSFNYFKIHFLCLAESIWSSGVTISKYLITGTHVRKQIFRYLSYEESLERALSVWKKLDRTKLGIRING